jgi:hypothetical protein
MTPKVKPRSPKPDNQEQYRRFVETAREAEADESPDAMDRAFERVVKPKNEPGRKEPRKR